jgi:hypothetical protein
LASCAAAEIASAAIAALWRGEKGEAGEWKGAEGEGELLRFDKHAERAGATQGRVASGAGHRRPRGVCDLLAVSAARASARMNAGGQAGPASPIGPKARPRPTKPGKISFSFYF